MAQALSVGLINNDNDKSFAVEVVKSYLNYGFDYILLGMRKVEYVEQLCHQFVT